MIQKMSNIYIVNAISVTEYKEEDLKRKHTAHNCLNERQLTYEEYLKFLKNWKEDTYSISSFISSFHLEYEKAKEYAENNLGDINEAGCYNYAAIIKAPMDCFYYNSYQNPKTDFELYKYNSETKKYELLDKSAKEYNYIINHLWGFI